jgi:pimeloyl-ACP methyl ester carboxylesterase
MRQLRAASSYDASGRLCLLDGLPTLVLSGASDRLALPSYGRALAAAIPGARYLTVEGAHGLPITHDKHVNALLSAHFTAAERHRGPLGGVVGDERSRFYPSAQ